MANVLASHLNDHVISNGLDNFDKSACKNGHLTKTALLSNKIEIHLAVARGEATAVILNQSAAFDTIDHSTLIECPGLVLESWFQTGLGLTSVTAISASRLAPLYCMVCPMALSWGQSCFHYTLHPSAKFYKINLALV